MHANATQRGACGSYYVLFCARRELDRNCREYDNLSLDMLKKCKFGDIAIVKKLGSGCSGEVYEVRRRFLSN